LGPGVPKSGGIGVTGAGWLELLDLNSQGEHTKAWAKGTLKKESWGLIQKVVSFIKTFQNFPGHQFY